MDCGVRVESGCFIEWKENSQYIVEAFQISGKAVGTLIWILRATDDSGCDDNQGAVACAFPARQRSNVMLADA